MKLYKYYSANGQNIAALINQQFWASKPRSFNDPYDTPVEWMKVRSAIALVGERTPDGSLVCKDAAPVQPTRSYTIEEIEKIKNMGIICFSSSHNEILLWSHYADQHKGYALEFDVPDDLSNTMIRRLLEVTYDPADYVDGIFNPCSEAPRYKHKAWEYEKEFRYLVDEGDKLYDWGDLGSKDKWFTLTGIIFGNRASEDNIRAITKITKYAHPTIQLMIARLSNKEFKLNIVPIEDSCKTVANKNTHVK